MENFLAAMVKQKLFVICLFLAIGVAGVFSLLSLNIDAFPDLANNQVQVITEAPGLGPIDVEQLVTIPLETVMNGLPNVEMTRSISKYGLSVVTVIFSDKVDTYFARQLVLERLQTARARLPADVNPELGPISTAMGEIFQYLVEGKSYSATELKSLQDWQIKYQLRTIPGVAEVNTWGGLTDEYEVEITPTLLQQYGLTLKDVFSAVARNNENFGAGIINHESEQFVIRGLGRVNSLSDIENITIKTKNGIPILVKNVGRVYHGAALRQGASTRDGQGETIVGLVMMLKGENSRAVIERVKNGLVQIQKTLPEGVGVVPFYDQSALVEQTIDTVKDNLLKGGFLVMLVLLLTVDSLPAALICAAAIPLSMMFGMLGMKYFGVTANIMSLGAIDFGMIVDGSIVMVENSLRNLASDTSGRSKDDIVQQSVREVARPILFGILIITIVYLPILGLEGMEYKMFSPMVVTVSSALIGSLFVSLLLVPVLCSLMLRGRKPSAKTSTDIGHSEKKNFFLYLLWVPYSFLFSLAMKAKLLTIGLAIAAGVGAICLVPFLGTEFVPRLDEGDVLIEIKNIPSISLPASLTTATEVESLVKKFPEVRAVVSRTGRPDLATDPMGVFATDCIVILQPKSKWPSGMTKDKLTQAMRESLEKNIAGAQFNFTQPIAMRVDELVSGVRADIAIKIFGDNMDYLQEKAKEIEAVIATVPGAADLQVERLEGAEQVAITPDRQRMARYGADIADVRDLAETAVIGRTVSQVIDGRKRFDLKVRLPNGINMEPEAIPNLLVETSSGKRVPLSQVADVKTTSALETINREQGQRRIVVQCNVRSRDIGSFVADCQKRISEKVKLNAGYYIRWGGQFENQQRALGKLSILVPLAIAIIFLLLTAAFASIRNALIVMLNVPFALIGGILALFVRGMYLSVPAAIGFIALFGVAVLNGVVLVSYVNRLVASGMEPEKAVTEGVKARFRPVIITALVAALGFLPMSVSAGSGAEVQKPLATVVIGGLLSSTLLTLLVLPVVYCLVTRTRRRKETLTDIGQDNSDEATAADAPSAEVPPSAEP
ncbi:MAG: efflux RND transporter permease subunit [Cyanobacteria bacterium SZAS TMP-1]|nr:efflux RND transporter permease subunit [Cyanobacteria bacterium SZAS TMP-1]